MNRRTFIRGTLISAAGTEALVRLATPEESKVLSPNREIVLGHPQKEVPFFDSCSPEIYMRHPKNGGFICVGICTQFDLRTEMLEFDSWNGQAQYIPGLKRGTIYFEGRKER